MQQQLDYNSFGTEDSLVASPVASSRIRLKFLDRLPRFLPLIVFLLVLALYLLQPSMDNNTISTEVSPTVKSPFKLVLFGDSLLNVPFQQFSLESKIQSKFPNKDMRIINSGINGDKISYMRARLQSDVLEYEPDAVMIFWDSDISDLSVDVLDSSSTQVKYEEDLIYVIQTLKANCSYLAVAGPCLLGEGVLFLPGRFQGKNRLLDVYRDINKKVCLQEDVEYIDLRQAFLDALPTIWLFSRWYTTTDGEHPNERGSQIIADKFGASLSAWFNK